MPGVPPPRPLTPPPQIIRTNPPSEENPPPPFPETDSEASVLSTSLIRSLTQLMHQAHRLSRPGRHYLTPNDRSPNTHPRGVPPSPTSNSKANASGATRSDIGQLIAHYTNVEAAEASPQATTPNTAHNNPHLTTPERMFDGTQR